MRTASRIAQLVLIALAVQAAGAERVHARAAVLVAAADAVATGGHEAVSGATAATLVATDGGAPLPFLGADAGTAGEGLEASLRAVRSARVGHRVDARPANAWRSTRAMTRARALALAYLDYSLALFQWRAGIPTNHTTAPPPNHS
jgi:hypothetical protein